LNPEYGQDWAQRELGGAFLGDRRLSQRLVLLASQLAADPSASIPKACGPWGQSKAAYRFFDNDKVNEDNLLEPHYQSTKERLRDHPVVLAVQDTTQIDFTSHPQTTGLGILSDPAHQGLFYHPTLLVSPEKTPLGLAHHLVWERPKQDFGKRHSRRSRPITAKESQKWLASLESMAQLQAALPQVCLVSVADREADVFDFFVKARELGLHLLVRAVRNRSVPQPGKYLWDYLENVPPSGHLTIEVPRRPGKAPRRAILTVRYSPVSVLPPKHRRGDPSLSRVSLWAVYAKEAEPPPGEAAISWLLLSTIPVTSLAEAQERLHWYTCRWQIEVFFKILKSGCRIEQLQLETAARLKRCLALYAVVAWRILYLTMESRRVPQLSCEALLAPEEWQALCCFIRRTPKPPTEPPTLLEATKLIARLGGFLGRASDGFPGPATLWQGMQRLGDIVVAWRLGRSP
jgi:Transposase DNA-binding/Transposase Tn5 dimerisation domain